MRWSIEKLTRRLTSVITLGHVTRFRESDKHPEIHAQYHRGTNHEKIRYLQPAGFYSNPGTGDDVEVLTVDPEAMPAHRRAIVVTSPKPVFAKEGETIIASPITGDNQFKVTEDGFCWTNGNADIIQLWIDAMTSVTPPTPQITALVTALTAAKDC